MIPSGQKMLIHDYKCTTNSASLRLKFGIRQVANPVLRLVHGRLDIG
jgi:hypothetical protein